jgi:hypothetical protein
LPSDTNEAEVDDGVVPILKDLTPFESEMDVSDEGVCCCLEEVPMDIDEAFPVVGAPRGGFLEAVVAGTGGAGGLSKKTKTNRNIKFKQDPKNINI